MQSPSTNESPRRLQDRLLYHNAQLSAEGVRPDLLPPVQLLMNQGRGLRDDREANHERLLLALARRDRQDFKADTFIPRFALEVLVLTHNRRDDPRYITLFPTHTPAALTRLPFTDEAKALRHLADALDADTFTSLRPHQQTLRDLADALDAAQAEVLAALDERARLSVRVTLFRLDVTRLLRKNYADLLTLDPHNKDAAEVFFKRFKGKKRKAKGKDSDKGAPDEDIDLDDDLDDEGDEPV